MNDTTLLATLTCISLLAGITAWLFAWKINSDWAKIVGRLLDDKAKKERKGFSWLKEERRKNFDVEH